MELIVSTAIVCGSVFAAFKLWLDRLHPQRQPDPSGAELLEALEAHKEAVKKDIEALHGKITVRQQTRMRE